MAKVANKKVQSQSQKDKFIAMAKELGEASEAAFNRVLKRVGKATATTKPKKKS